MNYELESAEMKPFTHFLFFGLSMALAMPIAAGEAQGQLTLDGHTVMLSTASALAFTDAAGIPTTVVILTDSPVDLSLAKASDDPFFELINSASLDGMTHALVFVRDTGTSINAHKAGDNRQFLATQKLGLDAKVSGGGVTPITGSLRSTSKEMSVQIDATFKAEVEKTGS